MGAPASAAALGMRFLKTARISSNWAVRLRACFSFDSVRTMKWGEVTSNQCSDGGVARAERDPHNRNRVTRCLTMVTPRVNEDPAQGKKIVGRGPARACALKARVRRRRGRRGLRGSPRETRGRRGEG